MTPQPPCCPNPAGCARGQMGPGHIVVHRHVEPRYRCPTGGHTFAATTGTPCSRVPTAADVGTSVLTVRCHGCPLQAMVAACGLEERPVAAWMARAGRHGQQGHQPVVQPGQVALPHVQAAERWGTLGGRRVGMAMAMAVPSRWWRGGVLSPPRDWPLITRLVPLVRSCGRSQAILGCVDGLARDVTAGRRVFRHPGRPGRPRVVVESGLHGGHVVKREVRRRVVRVERRVVRGRRQAGAAVRSGPKSGTGIQKASIERRHATCRAALAPLVHRGRAIAHADRCSGFRTVTLGLANAGVNGPAIGANTRPFGPTRRASGVEAGTSAPGMPLHPLDMRSPG